MKIKHVSAGLALLVCGVAMAQAPSVQVLPAERPAVPPSAAAGNGCWVTFFDGTEYRGEQLVLLGPVGLKDMDRTGKPWRDWDSVMVGTTARVGTFTQEGYWERASLLEPGEQISDLRGATGRFKDIESIWVDCVDR
ncbi:MAG: hypothetical protein ACK4PH_06445 [Aquincola tertiaricarbonis]|uniref:hypothetical protein n=1 Tax=Aquincola TaxID=391952 RepID=UPI000614D95C|nr:MULTISPECIES: hypothetical protein [Aquincola]MCR5863888.1 hypothetical protein [Aquincola sp. J276]